MVFDANGKNVLIFICKQYFNSLNNILSTLSTFEITFSMPQLPGSYNIKSGNSRVDIKWKT